MRKAKIIGAGSIGNHLAHAARRLDWSVSVTDHDPEALRRMREEIYPSRYGEWDSEISLYEADGAPSGGFDAIFIGTPPDSHLPLAFTALREQPNVLVIEKPLCPPTLDLLQEFSQDAKSSSTTVLVGYNHVVGAAARRVEELMAEKTVGEIITLDVEFREHWGGIFKAHPWLRGPQDSYLGSWQRGGGAGGEHSHGINLWQHFAEVIGAGPVTELCAFVSYVVEPGCSYDSICSISLRTGDGFFGRVIQDVVTWPPRKSLMLQGDKGRITLVCGYDRTNDAVLIETNPTGPKIEIIEKTRSDDFLQELRYVESVLAGNISGDALGFDKAATTSLLLHAAHESEVTRSAIAIDPSVGYTSRAVKPRGAGDETTTQL